MTGLPQDLLVWFAQYGYWVIFPLIVIEGPIITLVVGWLASLGFMNLYFAFFICIVGDLLGDTLYYAIGRFSRHKTIIRWIHWLGFSEQRLILMEEYLTTHGHRTFIFGKLLHGAGGLLLIAAGVVKYPYGKFFLYNVLPTTIKSVFFVLIGYYFGRAYNQYANILDYIALITLICLAVIYVRYIRKKVKFFR